MRRFVALAGTSLALAAAAVMPVTGVAYAKTTTKKCTVPNVVGKTEAAAKTAITAAGCKVGSVAMATSKTVMKGGVISESPKAGTKGSSSTKVNLKVSKGK